MLIPFIMQPCDHPIGWLALSGSDLHQVATPHVGGFYHLLGTYLELP